MTSPPEDILCRLLAEWRTVWASPWRRESQRPRETGMMSARLSQRVKSEKKNNPSNGSMVSRNTQFKQTMSFHRN